MSKQQWDSNFSNDHYIYGEKENEFVNEMSRFIPKNAKVACFAEGEGRNAVFLAKEGYDVTTYDISPIGLEKTNILAKKNNVNVKTVEIDLVKEVVPAELYNAAIMVFGHVSKNNQKSFLNNIFNSVKKGGHIMFEVYSHRQLEYRTGGPASLEMLYDPHDIFEMLKNYELVHFYYGEAVRKEGSFHTGLGHVIQAVVKK